MPEPRDHEQLERLAQALREAHPHPPLEDDFRQRLLQRIEGEPWTLSGALRRNVLLRVAAALLVTTTVAGPVTALIMLWQSPAPTPVELSWLPPKVVEEAEVLPPPSQAPDVAPGDPLGSPWFGLDWQEALERRNRMALVVRQWRAAGNQVLGAAAAPARMDWAEATFRDLQNEFDRRCQLGILDSPPPSLVQRIKHFALGGEPSTAIDPAADPDAPDWLRAWEWVIEGDRASPHASSGVPNFFGSGF